MSRYLVVGSWAMAAYLPDRRVPKDLDTFTDNVHLAGDDNFWHPAFKEWLPRGTDRHATLDELYTLKVSHSYWDLGFGSWEKHISDAAALKAAGARLDLGLHRLLCKVWEEKHGRKRVDLSLEADEFFADAVTRVYDHDSIHASVAYGDTAMYEAVLRDGATVTVDIAKVKALPFDDQVKLYREEVYATALERKVIPSGYRCSPRGAYAWALKRTITSLTKGWSARFLVENYDIFRVPDMDYVARHRSNSHKLIRLEAASVA
jgi:hypothetical protein